MIHRIFTILYLFFLCTKINAQIPAYYQLTDLDQNAAELYDELQELLQETHYAFVSYTPEVWNALKITDLDEENNQNVLLMYGYNDSDNLYLSDRTRDKDLSCHNSYCEGLWNREHVFPKSLAQPSLGDEGPGADVHNLRACDFQMNSYRGSRVFGSGNGNATVTLTGAFYPGDEWKGDAARIIMYMYLRFGNRCLPENVGEGGSTYSTFDNMQDMFLEWNAEDPPSAIELARNNHFENVQGNRNPIIDNPGLAYLIWNGPEVENEWLIPVLSSVIELDFDVDLFWIHDQLVFSHQLVEESLPISIFELNGKEVFVGSTRSEIDKHSMQSGVYILHVLNGKTNASIKFLVP